MDKKTLCLYFQVHQPIRLRKYHFFDIGKNSDYYDDLPIVRLPVKWPTVAIYRPTGRCWS